MNALLFLGRLAGIIGVLVCLVAGVARVAGHYFVAGYSVGTLFLGGIAAMVAGCLCLLWAMAARR